MKFLYTYILLATCCSFIVNAAGNQPPASTPFKQQINQAISDIINTPHKEWSVRIEHFENEEGDITSSVEQYTPHADIEKKWTLVSINGEQPTKKQIKAFTKKKLKRAENKKDDKSISLSLNSLIQQETLQLLESNEQHLKVGFQVQHIKRLGDDAIGKLEGFISYDRNNAFIEQIEIVNNAEFSPIFSANISDLKLTFNFVKIDNAILPKQQEMMMKGSFAYFTEIDEISTVTYSGYQHTSLD